MWGFQRETSVLPKSVTPERIQANFHLDGWRLADDEMERIGRITNRFKVAGDDWLPTKVFFGDDEGPLSMAIRGRL